MKIYRVCHIERTVIIAGWLIYSGPYVIDIDRASEYYQKVWDIHHEFLTDDHPTPDDEYLPIRTHEVCAFESLDQLREWFSQSYMDYLMDYGMVIREYDVETVRVGEHQTLVPAGEIQAEGRILDFLEVYGV